MDGMVPAGRIAGPFGVILRRDRDAGRPAAPVPRPRWLSKLRRCWPPHGRYGFIRLLTATLRRLGTVRFRWRAGWRAGDTGRRQPFSRACASVSRRTDHLVVLATRVEA